jgi:hypothetical protein
MAEPEIQETNDFIAGLGLDGRAADELAERESLESGYDEPDDDSVEDEGPQKPEALSDEEWDARQALEASHRVEADDTDEEAEDPAIALRIENARLQAILDERTKLAEAKLTGETEEEESDELPSFLTPEVKAALGHGMDLEPEELDALANRFQAAFGVLRGQIMAPLQKEIDALKKQTEQVQASDVQEQQLSTLRSNIATAVQHAEENGGPLEKEIVRELLSKQQGSRLWQVLHAMPGLRDSPEGIWTAVSAIARDIEVTRNPASVGKRTPLMESSVTGASGRATLPSQRTQTKTEMTPEEEVLQGILEADMSRLPAAFR